jgi:hypothetical protein
VSDCRLPNRSIFASIALDIRAIVDKDLTGQVSLAIEQPSKVCCYIRLVCTREVDVLSAVRMLAVDVGQALQEGADLRQTSEVRCGSCSKICKCVRSEDLVQFSVAYYVSIS